ncbi:MAG: SRPBCC family protein [Nitrosopumilus sp.]|uniref:SRPBCC family protein n=1 Tax=Nitrosopumilus sp. TaxID=2024843 RepID=UPI002470861E|nr:SRPBCC family protein [Nitrosopumilus sp.]MDH5430284.1 SRPBCC family protein [Nitrosopumilus sp.]MDH5697886.1 SRPBCC family protein [Nitrosopumilus sp.]
MVKIAKKTFHTGTVKKTIKIKASKDKVWKKISNIAGLPTWVVDVKKTTYLSKRKKDVGAIRLITFEDGNKIEEHIVAWKKGEYFTYIATEGLPLRAYVATISIKSKSKNLVELTWQSYLNSKKMSEKQFLDFVVFLGAFYEASLENLKASLEK